MKLRGESPVITVQKSKKWVEHQVVPALRMISKALGPSAFWQWLDSMTSNGTLDSKHNAAVLQYYRYIGNLQGAGV